MMKRVIKAVWLNKNISDKILKEKSYIEESKQSIKTHKYILNFQDKDEGDNEDRKERKSLDNLTLSKNILRIFDKKPKDPNPNNRQSEKEFDITEDKDFKKQVSEMLKMKYKIGFMKAISSVLYTFIILLLLLCIIFNCNALSVILFISVAFT